MGALHLPVMLREVIELLNLCEGESCKGEGTCVDATVGPGGHSEAILAHLGGKGQLVCMDRDEEILEHAQKRLGTESVRYAHARFSEMGQALEELGIKGVDAVLMDFGVSMFQLKTLERGFSFASDEPLDMRMDQSDSLTALEIVNRWPEKELARVIFEFGQERRSRRIASAICRARSSGRIVTCRELADIVYSAIGRGGRSHPATRTFQALRMAVNREMEEIDAGLEGALKALRPGGRIVTIAYHSLEDGKVKRFLRTAAREGRVTLLTKKPLVPSREELRENPSARSAKLRAAEVI